MEAEGYLEKVENIRLKLRALGSLMLGYDGDGVEFGPGEIQALGFMIHGMAQELKDLKTKGQPIEQSRQGPGKTKSQTKQKSSGNRVVSTQKEVAVNLDRSVRSIAYYKKKGMPVRPDGTYDLDEIDKWWSIYRQKDTPS
ncbi:MAG: hypothetical protein JRJ86_21700 [Deltaproteobacteria bacterium]|nr:hypothetical protein [Deltaproteobacteria bacterium]MBW2032814.1 hypothetical protein [Deltaproteobacteria bacterium]